MTVLLATTDPESLTHRASELIDTGRTGAARPLLAALRGQVPEAALRRLSARLLLSEGRLDEAGFELDAAIVQAPDDTALRKQRGQMRLQLGDLQGAAADAADAVILNRGDAEAKALLGVVLTKLGRGAEAVVCLHEALQAEPDNPAFRIAYARALTKTEAPASAIEVLAEGAYRTPHRQDLQEELVLALARDGRWQSAIDAAMAAQSHGALGPCGFGLLGHALSSLERHAEAADAYRDAYKLAPEDPYVRHMVAAAGDLPGGKRAPVEYLRVVFDGYADRFESHLIALGYRIPGVIRAMLKETGTHDLAPSLDLGCGTGLMAVALGDLAVHPMIGVDVAKRMLAQAARKGLYADLIEADIIDFLEQSDQSWKLIVASDVFCYIGPLETVFSLIARRLAPGGRFVFSVELLSPEPDGRACQLNPSARYAHTKDHVLASLDTAGLVVDQERFEILRYDIGLPVQGLIFSARRPSEA